MVGAVNIGVQRREFVIKGIADKALSGQVIAFIRLAPGEHVIYAREAFKGRGMESNLVPDIRDA
jgi:hypothetical protein